MELKEQILAAWANRDLLKEEMYANAVRAVIEAVDKGRLRTASPVDPSTNAQGGWEVNEWVKQAILMYFAIQQMETFTLPPFADSDDWDAFMRICIAREDSILEGAMEKIRSVLR